MKKHFFKNTITYPINITETQYNRNVFGNDTVTTLNCKNLSDLELSNIILVEKNDLNDKSIITESKEIDCSDFETAIKATEYGKFNWLILFSALWGYMSCMYATTSASLILPSAECDLNLSNVDKGMLNSVIYIGMIVSAFFWGLISDAIGRRNVLMVAFALDVFFSTLVALAQNFTFLVIAKLFTGFISSGPIAIMSSFLAENHSNSYRASVILCTGIFTSTASFTLPLLAWLIIPHPTRLVLFNGYIILPSWRIFLLISVIPSVLAFISLLFVNESPKFLMFQGKNEEALKVFKWIYGLNTGKPEETFPVKCLKNETGNNQTEMTRDKMSVKQILVTGWKQMVPMFQKPYFPLCLLPCFIQFCALFGVNTVRLWSPQLFASAVEAEKMVYNVSAVSTICELLVPPKTIENKPCSENIVSDKVYFNSMIIGVVTGLGYLVSGFIVKSVEKKWLMISAYLLSISCCFGLYWSTTTDYMLGVISVYIAFTSTAATALISAVVDIFPTSLRTTAVSLCMTFGRMGAMAGNMVFPVLLDWHCSAPFIVLAIVLSTAVFLNLFLPKTKGKNLE